MNRQRINQRDVQVVEGSHWCGHCQRVKPLDQFSVNHRKDRPAHPRCWCKSCERIWSGLREETPERKEYRKAHQSRPDVRERRRDFDRRRRATPKRAAKQNEYKLRYSRSPRGKLTRDRSNAVHRLAKATDATERMRLMIRIETCDRELERIKT
jgi:hypothetical protein